MSIGHGQGDTLRNAMLDLYFDLFGSSGVMDTAESHAPAFPKLQEYGSTHTRGYDGILRAC